MGEVRHQLSEQIEFTDPKTKEPPTVNLYATKDDGSAQAGPVVDLIKRGMQLAVCEMAAQEIAVMIGQATGADAVAKEISANLVGNAHLVAAGIVAANRAQDWGYILA